MNVAMQEPKKKKKKTAAGSLFHDFGYIRTKTLYSIWTMRSLVKKEKKLGSTFWFWFLKKLHQIV